MEFLLLSEHFFHCFGSEERLLMCPQTQKIEGALECPTKSLPPLVSSETAPHLCEEGQPKNAGAKPAIIFVCPSPMRVGAAEDEVIEVMIYWGNGTPPHLRDSLRQTSHHRLFFNDLVVKKKRSLKSESTLHLIGTQVLPKPTTREFWTKENATHLQKCILPRFRDVRVVEL